MSRTPKVVLALIALLALLALPSMDVGAARPAQATAAERDFVALGGTDAHGYAVPPSMELVRSFELPTYGLTYERYQQMHDGAEVLGGQITVYRDDAGESQLVIGARYDGIAPTNAVRITGAEARQRAARDVGEALERTVTLRVDPISQHFVYEVDSIQPAGRWRHLIDAGSGGIADRLNTLTTDHTTECTAVATDAPCGHGTHRDGDGEVPDLHDTKDLSGLVSGTGPYSLDRPQQGSLPTTTATRVFTRDQQSTKKPFLFGIATDEDGLFTTGGRAAPGQGALVDTHFYGAQTDEYLRSTHSFEWPEAAQAAGHPQHIELLPHYSKDYVNAFWNGSYAAFGDGDGISYWELTSLDVVAHELAHGITDFTSNLVYQDQSGALNESFSDIIGNLLEWYYPEPGARAADWLIGEDFDRRTSEASPGFRNMADPEEDGHPDHYSELYTGTSDNGGVHSNSGIPNHAFYLLAEGGRNASCRTDGTVVPRTDERKAHCGTTDNLDVTKLGVAEAEQIFFLGITTLPDTGALFCDARAGTIAAAQTLDAADTDSVDEVTSTAAAWTAVGVNATLCGDGGTDGGDTGLPAPTSLVATDGVDQVSLDWAYDDQTAGLAGYHVHRATVSGGPYDQITTSPVSSSDYTNTSLSAGTYYYVVTAVDTNGVQSPYSNEDAGTATTSSSGDPTLSVASEDYYRFGGKESTNHLDLTINVTDGTTGVGGVTVSIELFRDNQWVTTSTGITDSSGHVAFAYRNIGPGCYHADVTATKSGYAGNIDDPTNTSCDPQLASG